MCYEKTLSSQDVYSCMNRRELLAASGATLVLGVSGCLGDTAAGGNGDEESDDDDDSSETNDQEDQDAPSCQESPYIDEPTHEINVPEDDDEWNADYLGEHLETDPTLSFDVLYLGGTHAPYTDFLTIHDGDQAYVVKLIQSKEEVEEIIDLDYFPVNEDDERGEWFEAIDYDESVLLLVGSGMGSGSVQHRWARIEDVDDHIHLHGFYTDPQWKDDDYGPRYSAIAVELPNDAPDAAEVSLTISERCRVNFHSDDGIVVLEE